MAWAHNNWRNASFNPYKNDDRLLEGTVTAVRRRKENRLEKNEKMEEHVQVQMDLADVLAKPPDARIKWLQRALQFVASKGNLQISVFYDIVLHKRFVSGISVELAKKMVEMLMASLHIFSIKQKNILEPKLIMLGAYLDGTSEEESSSEDIELISTIGALQNDRSRSPSLANDDGKLTSVALAEPMRLQSEKNDTNTGTIANVAAVNAVTSAAKASAAAARGSAAAAAAVPNTIGPANNPLATAEDVFPSILKQSTSPSRSRQAKLVNKTDKKPKCSRSRSKPINSKDTNKAKEKNKSKKKDKKFSRSRAKSEKKRTSSKSRRKNKKSHSPSPKKKKKDKSKRKRRSKSKSINRTRSSDSDSSQGRKSKKDRSQSKHRRTSPKLGQDGSSIWLPPRESAKEAVTSSKDGKDSCLCEPDGNARRAALLGAHGNQVAGVNPQMRPGDWFCPICGAHNFSSKSQCFRCAKQPPHLVHTIPSTMAASMTAFAAQTIPGVGIGTTSHFRQDSLQAAQLNAARRLSAVPSPAAPVRSGDWFCPVCNAHNFASKSKCFRCMKGMNPRMGGGMV